MSDNLAAAAAALNVPESLVQRSAEARSKASGTPVEDILAAWAGGGSAPAPTTPPAAEQPEQPATEASTPEPEATTPDTEPSTSEPQAPAAAPQPGTAQPAPAQPAAAPVSPPPAPATVSPAEALQYPVVVSVPTAGLKERTSGSVPRWMAALFLLLPVFGLLYLTGSSSAAECRPDSPFLSVDRVTGALQNCDGSDFQGGGGLGGSGAAFVANGSDLFHSPAVGCFGCHGPNGGGGTGPALGNVLVTFSSCADHVSWVELGSAGTRAAGNTTYGDIAKPITGNMPSFGNTLSDEDLRSVVAFERIVFGGAPADETLVDCGLVEGSSSTETTIAGATTETTAAG